MWDEMALSDSSLVVPSKTGGGKLCDVAFRIVISFYVRELSTEIGHENIQTHSTTPRSKVLQGVGNNFHSFT